MLQLETEARQYGDMLVGEFLQEPRHNTLRTLLGLTWGLQHCSTAALGRMLQLTPSPLTLLSAVTTTDDQWLDVFALLHLLTTSWHRHPAILCPEVSRAN